MKNKKIKLNSGSSNEGKDNALLQEKAPREKDALGYLKEVQTTFADQPEVYARFLGIMKDFKSQALDTEGVIRHVKDLFKGNKSLVLGFNQFLPHGYQIDISHQEPSKKKHAIDYVAKIKNRFVNKPEIYNEFLEILREYQSKHTVENLYLRVNKLFEHETDLLREFRNFMPETKTMYDNNSKESNDNNNNQVKHEFPPTPNRRGRPPGSKKRRIDQSSTIPSIAASSSSSKIKAKRGRKPKAINERRTVSMSVENEQLPQEYNLIQLDHIPNAKDFPGQIYHFKRIREHCNDDVWHHFICFLDMYTRKIITRLELLRFTTELLGTSSTALGLFKTILNTSLSTLKKRSTLTDYNTFRRKADRFHDIATPSYRYIPNSVVLPYCSSQTSSDVLNDTCVSITKGMKEGKMIRKTIYEEIMYQVENERYEVDILIERNRSLIKYLTPIYKNIKKLTPIQGLHMTAVELESVHLLAIDRLYNESSSKVLLFLKESPYYAIPVIFNRLVQKTNEYIAYKNEMKIKWANIYKENYLRSLDCRSFCFKQEDCKRRSVKSLLNEIKVLNNALVNNISNENLNEELLVNKNNSTTLSISENILLPIDNYCMRFVYNDCNIHDLIYEIIRKTISQLYNITEEKKIHHFWTGFMHHILNIHNDNNTITNSNGNTIHIQKEIFDHEENLHGPLSNHTRRSKLFYSNLSFYHIFRLHQLLYSRLLYAKEQCFKHENGTERFHAFFTFLLRLLDAKVTPLEFSTACDHLFGSSSYIFKTLENLILQFIRRFVRLMYKPSTIQLLSLYQYHENIRNRYNDTTWTKEIANEHARMYHYNVCKVLLKEKLRSNSDLVCVKIEYFLDVKELCLGLVDILENIPYSYTNDDKKIDDNYERMWSEYTEKLISSSSSYNSNNNNNNNDNDNNITTCPPFLNRILRKKETKERDIYIKNDLTFVLSQEIIKTHNNNNDDDDNIDCNMKLWYKNETEDVFVRESVLHHAATNSQNKDVEVLQNDIRCNRKAMIQEKVKIWNNVHNDIATVFSAGFIKK